MADLDGAGFDFLYYPRAAGRENQVQPPSSRAPGPAGLYSAARWRRAAFADPHHDIHHAVADRNHQPGAIMSTSISDLIGTFFEAFSGKTELLDAVLTDDWDDIPLAPGQEPGLAGARTLFEGFSKAFSDVRIAVEEIIDARGEDGNGTVGVRAKIHFVHTGEFLGIAPTGRQTELRTHDFHQVVDGRIVRTHHMEDWLGWFQQVGFWPSG